MEVNPTRICELIVGLGDVEVVGVDDAPGGPLALHIRTRALPACGGCGGPVWSSGTSLVGLVDLPAVGRPVRLMWHKWRWRCPTPAGSPTISPIPLRIPSSTPLTTPSPCWTLTPSGRRTSSGSPWGASPDCTSPCNIRGASGLWLRRARVRAPAPGKWSGSAGSAMPSPR